MLQVQEQNYPADSNPTLVYLARLSKGSRRTTAHALKIIANKFGVDSPELAAWHNLRYQDTQVLRTWLIEHYRPATVNRMLSAVRGVLKEAFKLEHMSAEAYHRAASVEGVKNEALPSGRRLSAGEISALMRACQHGATRYRDSALIAVLYTCGLRRAEAVGLNLEDWNPEDSSLLVRGKGSKERMAYLDNGALQHFEDWLAQRGDSEGALFVALTKGGELRHHRINANSIYEMLKRRAKQAGIAPFSPHDLRRSFVSDLLDKNIDISTVSRMAGHSSTDITSRYDMRGESAKKKAAKSLHLPY